MKRTLILSLATLAIVAVSPAQAQDRTTRSATTEASSSTVDPGIIILVYKPTYPFSVDIATGKPLPEKPIEYVKGGKLFRLGEESSKPIIDADVAGYTKKIEDEVIRQQKPTYPLKTSAISDKPLGEKPIDKVHNNRLFRLADDADAKAFDTDKTKAITKLDKAYIDMQLPYYPYKKDPVTRDDIAGKETVKYLWGNKLIQFTSAVNVTEFEKTPETYLKVLETLK